MADPITPDSIVIAPNSSAAELELGKMPTREAAGTKATKDSDLDRFLAAFDQQTLYGAEDYVRVRRIGLAYYYGFDHYSSRSIYHWRPVRYDLDMTPAESPNRPSMDVAIDLVFG
ncbi:hypothetical protein EMPG_10938 [Blastomyces silverae]|uniref:Uncharacterized protein n=1 Tax=Blastomyces silverae TaxID=2060906 RepID=A0A0H1B3F6_9EURO|nr:hypothetical protein EMPG_10938 [Blastomyces silverae]